MADRRRYTTAAVFSRSETLEEEIKALEEMWGMEAKPAYSVLSETAKRWGFLEFDPENQVLILFREKK